MALFEEAVRAHLTGPPHRFVRPHVSLAYKGIAGGSWPDFVALDYQQRVACVVEVSAASDINGLLAGVGDRQERWHEPLAADLTERDASLKKSKRRTTIFVLADRQAAAARASARTDDVTVIALDDIMRPWMWRWKGQIPETPLDRGPCGSSDGGARGHAAGTGSRVTAGTGGGTS